MNQEERQKAIVDCIARHVAKQKDVEEVLIWLEKRMDPNRTHYGLLIKKFPELFKQMRDSRPTPWVHPIPAAPVPEKPSRFSAEDKRHFMRMIIDRMNSAVSDDKWEAFMDILKAATADHVYRCARCEDTEVYYADGAPFKCSHPLL